MSNWPPDPNKRPDEQRPDSSREVRYDSRDPQPSGREWQLIEKTLLASVEEQRRARRWSIFFKLLTFGYIILLFVVFGRGCNSSNPSAMDSIDTSKPHLAVVDVEGVISSSDTANAEDINKALSRAFKNSNAQAVVLNINSPGGSPVQSDEIWSHMRHLREQYPDKKLYAVIGDIGASGAYYIASAADEIWVNPSSLVGSIGVIMQSYNVEGLLDKIGVKDRTITSGEYKDILSMSRPLTEYEQQHVQKLLDNTHQHFVTAVKTGRGERLKNPEQNQIFTGLFWTGEQSIELGLADHTGGMQALSDELNVDTVVNYSPVDPFKKLLDRFAVQLGVGIGSTVQLPMLPNEQQPTQLR